MVDCDNRDELAKYLLTHGAETKIHYPVLLHKQHAARTLGIRAVEFSNAERLVKRRLSLPIYHELTNGEADYVIGKVNLLYA